MKDIAAVGQILKPIATTKAPAQGGGKDGFVDFLKSAVGEVNKAQNDSDQAVEKLQTGKAKNLHDVMIRLEEADISMRMLVQMRNKIVDAYQEVMRMQV
jgi:flagellar hook-basal body complex protein FliE